MEKDTEVVDRSCDKLKRYVREEVTKVFTSVLDYAEVAIDGEDRYSKFRSKILKVSNDAIRKIERELESRYKVSYVPDSEDIIKITYKK